MYGDAFVPARLAGRGLPRRRDARGRARAEGDVQGLGLLTRRRNGAGRANIVVYNWGGQGSVSVDLSGIVPAGAQGRDTPGG